MVRRSLAIILLLASSLSGQVIPSIQAFNAGEVSPLFEARSDFAKYDNACRTLQNMLVLTQGPVTRRPGTAYIAEVKTSADYARLIPFEYSKSDTYVIELGDLYARFYRNGGQILSGANPYEIVTIFTDDEVFEIQYVQSANSMYLVHPDHPPQVLTRTAHTSWTIADYDYEKGPFLPENETTTTIDPSAVTGVGITLTASVATFNVAGHPDSLWKISHRVPSASVSGALAGDGSSANLPIGGAFDFSTKGTWTGSMTLERSDDAGVSWEPTPGFKASVNDDNVVYADTELDAGIIYRVTMSDHTSGTATYNLAAASYIQEGYVQITAVASTTSATATVLTDMGSHAATTLWSEAAWSDYRGWPQTVEFHEQRLVFGCNENLPQTVWFSATADYENMEEGTIDDDAFIYELPGQNPIQWLLSQDFLMLGTLGGIGKIGTETTELTPSAPIYKSQSRPGSAYIQAVLAGDAILYVERGGEKVREIAYSLERDNFTAPDMTVLAEHIAAGGIVDIAYQARPDSILWCVRDDGVLLSLTYKREQDVVAWARHTTEGEFESVTVIPGTGEDEVWVVVKRTIDGSTVRYVEQFQPRDWSDQEDCYFVDSGLSFDGGDSVVVTNITQANPAVVTVSSWPADADGTDLADGDQVRILSVVGMTETNDNVYTVDDSDGVSTFSLDDSASVGNINSSAFTAYTSGGTVQWVEKDFSGLDHLEGEEVTVFAEGAYVGTANVASGIASVSEWANTAHIGLEYTSILETLPIVFDTKSGSAAPKLKKIASFEADVFETLGFYYGSASTDVFGEMPEIESDAEPIPAYTGFRHCTFPYGHKQKTVVYIQETRPIPLTIRAIYPDMEITE